LAYTVSVTQEPSTTTLLSPFTSGAGTWKRTLAAGSDGGFSWPPVEPPAPPPPLGSVPPSAPPLVAVSFFLSSPLEAYQTPPPTIRAIATTAATMIATCGLIFRPPPPGCGCIGMVPGCG
jgi:hypothetical protein